MTDQPLTPAELRILLRCARDYAYARTLTWYGDERETAQALVEREILDYGGMLPRGGYRTETTPEALGLIVGRLIAAVREVAASGVESDDPRLPYVVVQIDRDLWRRALELGGKGAV